MSEQIYDLLVIGGGGAGLPAALNAIEQGASRVILLEKRPTTGGNAAMAGGFLFAAESRLQKEAGQVVYRDDVFKELMEYHHYDRIDPRLIRLYVDGCASTIDWIEERSGVPYMFGDMHILRSHMPKIHNAPVGTFSRVTRALTDRFKQNGGEVLYKTWATGLERDIDGRTLVVRATNNSDESLTFKARSVVIASGGFTGNIPKLEENFPHYYDDSVYWNDTVDNMGEGIDMATGIGAASDPYCTLIRETGYSFMTKKSLPNRAGLDPRVLWVNGKGRRFCDETVGHDNAATNALLNQPGKVGYALFDNALIDRIMALPNDLMLEEMAQEIDIRAIFDAESRAEGAWCRSSSDLAGLAEWMGADPKVLEATVAEYNQYCAQGRDGLFAKAPKYLIPLSEGPFYALKFRPLMIETAGPIKVNEHMEVLDEAGEAIPGCFAAGALVGGWVGHDYHLFGYALSWSILSGRVAGDSAVAYLQKVESIAA